VAPVVVGVGGSAGARSISGLLLRRCLDHATQGGAQVQIFDGSFLAALPIFTTDSEPTGEAIELVEAVRGADAVLVSTPGYHGGMSGLVKNALDHLEALRGDVRPYLDGRAVGIIVTAGGWQSCGTTLVSTRSAVHALRGWPTPFGATVNSAETRPDDAGRFDARVEDSLALLARQMLDFANWQAAARATAP
jgi:FMN reductase